MTPLVLHNRDPYAFRSHSPEIDDVWKASHQTPSDISGDDHPSFRRRNQGQDLSLELIDELNAQPGAALFIKPFDFSQLVPNGRMIVDPHPRSRPINSSCETGCTSPASS
jgi:hypothetical protein